MSGLIAGSFVAPHTGLSACIELQVTEANAAKAFRSGPVPVLTTPQLMALCEEASCRAIEGELPDNYTSVTKRVQFDHLVPVRLGGTVLAEAILDRIEGRRLVFILSVSQRTGLVAAGTLIRVIVDRDTFLSNIR